MKKSLLTFKFLGTILLLVALFAAGSAQARVFKTQFIHLDLPPGWDCHQEEIDWICQPASVADRSEAIVVIVTKAVNEVDDTMEKYDDVLKEVRDMRDLLGNPYKSQVKYTRKRPIKGWDWIDSLHFGSEIPGFYTRYIASIKERVAGLVSYSIAESVYPKWAKVLDEMIDSLEIIYDPKAFAEAMKPGSGSLLGKSRGLLNGRKEAGLDDNDAKKAQAGSQSPKDLATYGAIALIVAALAFYVYKKRKG